MYPVALRVTWNNVLRAAPDAFTPLHRLSVSAAHNSEISAVERAAASFRLNCVAKIHLVALGVRTDIELAPSLS